MQETQRTSAEWQAVAENERRLGLLILENKDGPELASGAAHLRSAAEAWEQAGWPARQAECLLDVAKLQEKRGRFHEAAEASAQALRIFESSQSQRAEACDAALRCGANYREAGDLPRAARYASRAVEIADALNDHLRMAASHRALGATCLAQEDSAAAIDEVSNALKIFTDYRKQVDVATCHQLLGQAHHLAGYHTQASEAFEQAISCYETLGRRFEVSEVLSAWADLDTQVQRHAQALTQLERCRTIHQAAGNRELESQVLRLTGSVYLSQGDAVSALDAFEHALDIAKGLNNVEGQARALYLLGNAYTGMDDSDKAQQSLTTALELAQQQPNAKITERILAALAKLQRQDGNPQAALHTMEQWVAVLKDLGERQDALHVLGSMARLKLAGDDLADAESHLRRLLSVCTRPEDRSERLYAAYGLASLLVKSKRQTEAIPHFQTALDGYSDPDLPTIPPPVPLDRMHVQLGNCLLELGQSDDALIHFGAAEQILGSTHDDQEQLDENAKGRFASARWAGQYAHSAWRPRRSARLF